MTGPNIWDSGPASDRYFQELSAFNAQRDSFYQTLLNGLGQIRQPGSQPTVIGQTPPQQQFQQSLPPSQWQDEDLVGAAKFWGIPEEVARHMPHDVLANEIQKLRSSSRPDENNFASRLGQTADMLMAVPEMIGAGFGEAVTGGLGKLPFIGGALRRNQNLHDADMFFRSLEEGIRSSTPDDFQWVNTVANVTGNVGALWFPGAAAWKLAGGVIPAALSQPLLRAAGQGALSAEMLQGGTDSKNWYDLNPEVAKWGAGLGAGFSVAAPILEALGTKLVKKFLPPDISTRPQGPWPSGNQTGPWEPTVPADVEGPLPLAGGMSSQSADRLALQMNKVGQIMESPVVGRIAAEALPNETSVAVAAQASNPGGINLVDGLSDPASFMASMGDSHFAFAQRNGRLAALISDQPIKNIQVVDFQLHGMFRGQTALTSGGNPAEILGISPDGIAKLRYPGSSLEFFRPTSDLSPQSNSPGVMAVPKLWSQFDAQADQLAFQTQQAMGLPIDPATHAAIKVQNMAGWMDDFLNEMGVAHPGDRARISNYFNDEWIKSFYQYAPEEMLRNFQAQDDLNQAVIEHDPTPVGMMDEQAASKGFVASPNGQGGWNLTNTVGENTTPQSQVPLTQSFESPEAAGSYLVKLSRSLPEVSPNTTVPGELAGVLHREPPPEINVNQGFTPQITASINQMAGGSGAPPVQPQGSSGPAGQPPTPGALNSFWKDGFLQWEPQRRVFAKLSETMHNAFGDDFGVAKTYDQIGVALNQHHTAMHGPQNDLADIFSHTSMGSTKRLLTGEWTDVWSSGQNRLAKAQNLNWSPKDVQSLTDFDNFLDKVGGPGTSQQIQPLLQYMRTQVSQGQNPWAGGNTSSPSLMAWYHNAKGASYNLRELDPRRLGDSIIRGIHWQQNMLQPWMDGMAVANQLKQDPQMESAGHYIDNWLDIVKNGYRPEDDIALAGIHAVGRGLLGSSFSKQQAKELVSLGLDSTHASLLGYRVHVMARDALQLMFAIPRAGPDLLNVMSKFTSDAQYRSAIWNEVLGEGAASMNLPAQAAPGALGGELEMAGAGIAPQDMSRRMQGIGMATGAIRDLAPDFLKGSSDSIMRPLYLYAKQGQMMRTLVYKAGQEKANRALGEFRAAGANASLPQLMHDSGASTYDLAWQEEFKRLVGTGDDHAASVFLGRQLADATQFKYGVAESPAVARTVTGKLFMQMGSYQTQYLQMLRESLKNGSIPQRTSQILMFGTVSAALAAASKKTGWNFNYMNPYAIGFAGGPWISTGAAMLGGAQGIFQTMNQGDSPFAQRAMAAGGYAAGQAMQNLNPVQGLYNTASGIGSALNDSPTPGMALGRLAITGERGAMPDILNSISPADFSQSQPNPVRLQSMQLPQIPQMQVVDPSGAVPPGNPKVSNRDDLIPFTNTERPGQPSGYSPDDVKAVLMSQQGPGSPPAPQARNFAHDELQFLRGLSGVPLDSAVQMFRGYMDNKLKHNPNPGGGYSLQPGHPGGGLFF